MVSDSVLRTTEPLNRTFLSTIVSFVFYTISLYSLRLRSAPTYHLEIVSIYVGEAHRAQTIVRKMPPKKIGTTPTVYSMRGDVKTLDQATSQANQ